MSTGSTFQRVDLPESSGDARGGGGTKGAIAKCACEGTHTEAAQYALEGRQAGIGVHRAAQQSAIPCMRCGRTCTLIIVGVARLTIQDCTSSCCRNAAAAAEAAHSSCPVVWERLLFVSTASAICRPQQNGGSLPQCFSLRPRHAMRPPHTRRSAELGSATRGKCDMCGVEMSSRSCDMSGLLQDTRTLPDREGGGFREARA
eukprot:233650-Chlamydomonas_euryale.AAC.5